MKRFWKYFFIVILFLLGLICVGVLYLFFSHRALFGLQYISYHETKTVLVDVDSSFDTIALNSRSYDISVSETSSNQIKLDVNNNSFGFVLVKNSKVNISTSIKDGILTINISEPYGACLKNGSAIEMLVPKSFNYNLKINNKSATTNLNSGDINNLTYSTISGNLNLKGVSVNGAIDLNLNKADFIINDNTITNNNDINLNISTGKFDTTKTSLGKITISSNERGVILIGNCENLFSEVKGSTGGRIEANEIGQVKFEGTSTNISIAKVTAGAVIHLNNSNGKIAIQELNGSDSLLHTNSGDIYIGQANDNLVLRTDSGNITVNKAFQTIDVASESGETIINFDSLAESNKTNSNARKLIAELNNGSLKVDGVENLSITVNGNCSTRVNMKDVSGVNEIKSNSGSVFVKIDSQAVYTLKTSSDINAVRVNLTQIPEYNGYTTNLERVTNVNSDVEQANKLTVFTKNASLTILDTNF